MTTSTSPSRTSSRTASAGAAMLAHPVQTVTETVSHVPGAGLVKGAVDGVLDTIGAVSPRARRVAAYAGAGLLGAAGVIEWPVAAAGAAVVWLTQPRPKHEGAMAPEPSGKKVTTAQQRKRAAKQPAKPAKATKTTARSTAGSR